MIWRNCRHYAASHVLLALAWAVCLAMVAGALLVGPALRATLSDQLEARLGKIQSAVGQPGRVLSTALAERLAANAVQVAPIRQLRAAASTEKRQAIVHCYGVDARFFALSPAGRGSIDGLLINRRAAELLALQPGDELVLRLPRLRWLPGDAPLAPGNDDRIALRLPLQRIIGPEEFGAFNLQPEQAPVANVFLPLAQLNAAFGVENEADFVLSAVAPEALRETVAAQWQPADVGLQIDKQGGGSRLRSRRVLLDPPLEILREDGGLAVSAMLATALRHGEADCPYSIIVGLDPALLSELGASGPVINSWLAEDIGAAAGDAIDMDYLLPDATNHLREHSCTLQVAAVTPIAGLAADRDLMPDWPGLSAEEDCADWDAGMPIDLARIRVKDEDYWDRYRGTPKLFLPLAQADELWRTDFGLLSELRFPQLSQQELAALIRARIEPATIGLAVQPLRAMHERALDGGLDFGFLLLAMNQVLIAASCCLLALQGGLALHARRRELGALLAMGFRPLHLRRRYLREQMLVLLPALPLGLVFALAFAWILLGLLHRIWAESLLPQALTVHWDWWRMIAAYVLVQAGYLLILRWRLGRLLRQPAARLLRGDSEDQQSRPTRARLALLAGCLLPPLSIVLALTARPDIRALVYYGAGFLLLLGLLALLAWWLWRAAKPVDTRSAGVIARAGLRRRPGRHFAGAALLALAAFMVVAVGSQFRHQQFDALAERSPSGGFDIMVDLAIPLHEDPTTEEGREKLGIDARQWAGSTVLPLRVLPGGQADCTNLMRSSQPPLIGIDPQRLQGRFIFQAGADDWDVLAQPLDGALPVVVDENTLLWALGGRLGSEIELRDEFGQPLRLRAVATIADAILQGSLVLNEADLRRHFPSLSGYARLLVDSDGAYDRVAEELDLALGDLGCTPRSSKEWLGERHRIQNGYIAVFQLLGSCGLLLGVLGVGLFVLRDLRSRAPELAALHALGFSAARIRRQLLREYLPLYLIGLAIGSVAGLWSASPNIGRDLPGAISLPLAALLLFAAVLGWLCLWLALRWQCRHLSLRALSLE